jgi:hypothetical protein
MAPRPDDPRHLERSARDPEPCRESGRYHAHDGAHRPLRQRQRAEVGHCGQTFPYPARRACPHGRGAGDPHHNAGGRRSSVSTCHSTRRPAGVLQPPVRCRVRARPFRGKHHYSSRAIVRREDEPTAQLSSERADACSHGKGHCLKTDSHPDTGSATRTRPLGCLPFRTAARTHIWVIGLRSPERTARPSAAPSRRFVPVGLPIVIRLFTFGLWRGFGDRAIAAAAPQTDSRRSWSQTTEIRGFGSKITRRSRRPSRNSRQSPFS